MRFSKFCNPLMPACIGCICMSITINFCLHCNSVCRHATNVLLLPHLHCMQAVVNALLVNYALVDSSRQVCANAVANYVVGCSYVEGPRQPVYRVIFYQKDLWEGYNGTDNDNLEIEVHLN